MKGDIYFFVFKYFDSFFSSRLQNCGKVFKNHVGCEIRSHISAKIKIFQIFFLKFHVFTPLVKISKNCKNLLQFAFKQLGFYSTENCPNRQNNPFIFFECLKLSLDGYFKVSDLQIFFLYFVLCTILTRKLSILSPRNILKPPLCHK